MTAWRMVVTQAQVRPGQDVLVIGVGGGVSSTAVQIARLCGARVIVTSSDDAKLEKARALGAEVGINYKKNPGWAKDVFEATGKRGVDVVIEHVGEATWPKSIRALARGGRLVTCGATSGPNGAIDLRALFARQLTIHGSYMGTKAELLRAARFFFAGQLKPVVDRTFPLAEAAAAHRRMEDREQFGKIVLEV
jgi:NADPH:quinone reductase-like Zn-dependent oxidoreductase